MKLPARHKSEMSEVPSLPGLARARAGRPLRQRQGKWESLAPATPHPPAGVCGGSHRDPALGSQERGSCTLSVRAVSA